MWNHSDKLSLNILSGAVRRLVPVAELHVSTPKLFEVFVLNLVQETLIESLNFISIKIRLFEIDITWENTLFSLH
jgi:hypothetical protein